MNPESRRGHPARGDLFPDQRLGGADRAQRTTDELLGAALQYARLGWPVHPLHPPTAHVVHPGKQPILPDWTNAASTDPAVIRGWWARWPDANVGIATGPRSGLAVLDLDPRSGGAESLTELETRVGVLPGTAYVITGGDGLHMYYRHPGVKVTSRAHSLGRGLDVKADGGQVVAPPSIHPSGNRYRWSGNDGALPSGDVAGYLAPWPVSQLTPAAREQNVVHLAAARARLSRPGRRGASDPRSGLAALVDVVLKAGEGNRNNALHWAVCRAGEGIAAGQYGREVAIDALAASARAVGLDEREITATIRSALRESLGSTS